MPSRKKILVIIVIAISLLASLPMAGNQLVKDKLDANIEILSSNGIEVRYSSEDSRYLSSSRHYEFELRDIDKFLEYLGRNSYSQLPSYTSAILKGTVVGADIKYSNIPFMEDVSLDIYPLNLSTDIMSEIKENDKAFHEYVNGFLANKGMLYHINYNIISEDFDGFVKDVDENHTLKNGSKLLVKITDNVFSGNGILIAPKFLKTDARKIMMKVMNSSEEMSIDISDFSSLLTFESKNTYSSAIKIKSLALESKAKDSISIKVTDMLADVSSSTNGTKAQMSSSSSFSDINITSNILNINASDFNYEVALFDIDKDSMEELRELMLKLKTNNSIGHFARVKDSSFDMLSKGMKLNIKDLSVKNIEINGDDLKGFSINSKLNLKSDQNLAQNINFRPMYIARNLDVDFNLRVSERIYSKVVSLQPIAIFAQGYSKRSGEDLVFDIALKNGEFKINSKASQN